MRHTSFSLIKKPTSHWRISSIFVVRDLTFFHPNSTVFDSNPSDFLTSVMNIGANEGASDRRQNCSLFLEISIIIYPYMHIARGPQGIKSNF